MGKPMNVREKVIRAIEIYAEGGALQTARDGLGLSGRDFYRALDRDVDLKQLYYDTQRGRADMMYDEAYVISTDSGLNPNAARVMAEIRMKIGQAYDRKRFGEKIGVEVDAGPNLQAALEAAKSRALLPGRDLGKVIDAQCVDITQQITKDATDTQSGAAPKAPLPDIFED